MLGWGHSVGGFFLRNDQSCSGGRVKIRPRRRRIKRREVTCACCPMIFVHSNRKQGGTLKAALAKEGWTFLGGRSKCPKCQTYERPQISLWFAIPGSSSDWGRAGLFITGVRFYKTRAKVTLTGVLWLPLTVFPKPKRVAPSLSFRRLPRTRGRLHMGSPLILPGDSLEHCNLGSTLPAG